MRWFALPVGLVILLFTLLDVFRTLVMPRAARGRTRLARLLFRPMWRPWRWVGVRAKTTAGRERKNVICTPSCDSGGPATPVTYHHSVRNAGWLP